MNTIYHALSQSLAKREANHLLRVLPQFSSPPKLNFASNDYLGLSTHPVLIKALSASQHQGMGQRGSRLLMPYQSNYLSLEKCMAKSTGFAHALLFASGFQANATLIRALINPKLYGQSPLVFSDRRLHASFHFGCDTVKQYRYPHQDLNYLERLLIKHQSSLAPKMIITESLFGMDGDKTDINTLIALKKKYNAFLIIDESHALGVYGQSGYGLFEGRANDIDIVTSSLSKGLGVWGGVVLCHSVVYEYLINTCFGIIYSNALPFPIVNAIQTAWDLLPSLKLKRQYLHQLSQNLINQLKALGLNTGHTESHLIPIIIGNNEATLKLKQHCLDNQIWVGAIRPPSVPHQLARIRICLNATHSEAELSQLVKIIKKFKLNQGV